jgi:hypothetical protein
VLLDARRGGAYERASGRLGAVPGDCDPWTAGSAQSVENDDCDRAVSERGPLREARRAGAAVGSGVGRDQNERPLG